MSNAICRMSTGGGFRTRALYTDDDEAIFTFMRPVLVNGISNVVVKPDLLDRTLTITLPHITKASRKAESEFWKAFEVDWPTIFGALLDVLALALKALPDVRPAELPRMADFAAWAGAVEQAMEWEAGAFAAAFGETEREAEAIALEGSPIADLLVNELDSTRRNGTWDDLANRVLWSGTMLDLLELLRTNALIDLHFVHDLKGLQQAIPAFPRTPEGLRHKLAEIEPHLRKMGLEIIHPVGTRRNADGKVVREHRIIDHRPDNEFDQAQGEGHAPKPVRRGSLFDNPNT
jgi:hypothetical protein